MRFKVLLAVWTLWIIPVSFSPSAQTKDSEARTRDLSNMFYSDTLPAKEVPPTKTEPKKKPITHRPVKKPSQPAVNISSAERRVGLKYRIMYRTPDCDIQEVDPSHTFYSGDKIRLQFESNVDGYLYVLQKGSSGSDKVLFPSPQINGGANRIERGIQYSVPAKSWFEFDPTPGEEHLTVIVSRTPMKTLPQQAKPQEDGSVSVVSVVDELNKSVRSRDLVLFQEKAPAVASSAQPISAPATQATIVINTSEDQNNTVYTEIKLKHK